MRALRTLVGAFLVLAALGPAAAVASHPSQDEDARWYPSYTVTSPDGRFLYASGSYLVTFARDTDTGSLRMIDHDEPGISTHGGGIAITPDGRWVYETFIYAGNTGRLMIFSRDADSGHLTYQGNFNGGEDNGPVLSMLIGASVSPDGHQLYLVTRNETALMVYDIDQTTGRPRFREAHYGQYGGEPGPTVTADGRNVYATYSGGFARDADTGLLTPLGGDWDATTTGNTALVNRAGTRVYSGSLDYLRTSARDPETGQLKAFSGGQSFARPGECEPYAGGCQANTRPLAVSPEGGSVFVSRPEAPGLLQLSATATGLAFDRTYGAAAGVYNPAAMTWSADGRFAYLTTHTGFDETDGPDDFARGAIATYRWHPATDTLELLDVNVPRWKLGDLNRQATMTINDGDLYTNDPDVKLSVTPPAWASSLRMANDPDLVDAGRARSVDDDGRYSWRLEVEGPPNRSVRRVYVSFPALYGPSFKLQDDIILDLLRPVVTSARLDRASAGTTLVLKAKDNRTGLRKLQLADDRKHPHRARRFKRRLAVGDAPKYVRVVDGAGNRSKWRRVSGG